MLNYEERIKLIEKTSRDAAEIIQRVSEDYIRMNEKRLKVGDCIINKYIPTPFDIAKYYGIRIKYKKMRGNILSYFKRECLIIYISDIFKDKKYLAGQLVAHELGHFFSDCDELSAMNIDSFNEVFPGEVTKEYKANLYALYFEPRMLADYTLKDYSVDEINELELNEFIYNKITKNLSHKKTKSFSYLWYNNSNDHERCRDLINKR